MDTNQMDGGQSIERPGVAFLLAQLGAHATALFADRVGDLGLTSAQAGLLRMVATRPGSSQQDLAAALSVRPTRFVTFADELEQRGLIERRKNPDDRRLHALYLTAEGKRLLGRLRTAATAHEEQICAGLSSTEAEQLFGLLTRLAGWHELTQGAHPGLQTPDESNA